MNDFIAKKNGFYKVSKVLRNERIKKEDREYVKMLKERFPDEVMYIGSRQIGKDINYWAFFASIPDVNCTGQISGRFGNREEQYKYWLRDMKRDLEYFICDEKVEKMEPEDFVLLYEMYHDTLTSYEIKDVINIYKEIIGEVND